MMMVTSCDAVVEHGEDKEGGVEAGENHQQVVERVPHAEKGHWLDIYDNHPYPLGAVHILRNTNLGSRETPPSPL